MLLSVELNPSRESIVIYADKDGLESLIGTLNHLLERGGHDHLMTPSFAGHELTEERFDDDTTLIHQITIARLEGRD